MRSSDLAPAPPPAHSSCWVPGLISLSYTSRLFPRRKPPFPAATPTCPSTVSSSLTLFPLPSTELGARWPALLLGHPHHSLDHKAHLTVMSSSLGIPADWVLGEWCCLIPTCPGLNKCLWSKLINKCVDYSERYARTMVLENTNLNMGLATY